MKIYTYKNDEHDNSTFAHQKLKEILKKEYGYILTELTYNKYNKPYLIDNKYYFNISHSKNIVTIAIDTKEIGIDIEFYNRYNPKYLNQIFSKEEISLISSSSFPQKEYSKLWCMKESLLKCLGLGIKKDMRNILNNKDEYDFTCYDYDDYCIVVCTKK